MPVLDEASFASGAALQQYLQSVRRTRPRLEAVGDWAVDATWAEYDTERIVLSLYEILLCRAVARHAPQTTIGFETGEWPGGRWYDQPGWRRAVWLGFRRGQFDREGDGDVHTGQYGLDRQPGER